MSRARDDCKSGGGAGTLDEETGCQRAWIFVTNPRPESIRLQLDIPPVHGGGFEVTDWRTNLVVSEGELAEDTSVELQLEGYATRILRIDYTR